MKSALSHETCVIPEQHYILQPHINDLFHDTAPPVFIVRPQNVMALVSESVMLSCSATGQPQPSIRWLNSQGEDILPSTSVTITETTPTDDEFLLMSVLTFLSVSLDDSGTYVCSASNEDGTITTSAILSVTGMVVDLCSTS